MLYVLLILATVVGGTIQGQANDNSPFAWISVSTELDGKERIVEVYLGEEYVINVDGNSVGSQTPGVREKEFYCLLNGGFSISSLHFCVIAEMQILQGENGEKNLSFFGKAIFSIEEEEGAVKVSVYEYAVESHKS